MHPNSPHRSQTTTLSPLFLISAVAFGCAAPDRQDIEPQPAVTSSTLENNYRWRKIVKNGDPSQENNMAVARGAHTATLLSNGNVLVVGGVGVTQAELYNPLTNEWTLAGNLSHPRNTHTANYLYDGTDRVLVFGGAGLTKTDQVAELYDADSDQLWTVISNQSGITPRYFHTATSLGSGYVLIVGGWFDKVVGDDDPENEYNENTLNEVILFSPDSTLTVKGTMDAARTDHAATLLADSGDLPGLNGSVLITGGRNGSPSYLPTIVYDVSEGTWSVSSNTMIETQSRFWHTATPLTSTQVLVTGGYGIDSTEVFDSDKNRWILPAKMTIDRRGHQATLLRNGKVLVTGGVKWQDKHPSVWLSTAEIYDPIENKWSQTDAMLSVRSNHTATLLKDGRVLVTGGSVANAQYLATAEIYTPDGALCSSGDECPTGACINGVCCNTACDGDCEVCSKDAGAISDGTCTPLPQSDCENPVPEPGLGEPEPRTFYSCTITHRRTQTSIFGMSAFGAVLALAFARSLNRRRR
jgi:hypothetical protein